MQNAPPPGKGLRPEYTEPKPREVSAARAAIAAHSQNSTPDHPRPRCDDARLVQRQPRRVQQTHLGEMANDEPAGDGRAVLPHDAVQVTARASLGMTDDWPEIVPITDAELRVMESHFAEELDELFGPRA